MIRVRRKVIGLSQADVARGTGIAEDRLEAFESGEERIEARSLAKIADFLGVPTSSFFEGLAIEDGVELSSSRLSASANDEDILVLSDLFVRLGPEQRRRLLKLMRALSGKTAGTA